MILVLDIGNSNITMGGYKDNKLLFVSRIATSRTRMEDQYASELRGILDLYQIHSEDIHGSIISSVVPPLSPFIKNAVEKVTQTKALFVDSTMKTDLKIALPHPETVGADLIVGCVATLALYGVASIFWDLGTATKACVLSKDAAMLGGCIMPGVAISMNALSSLTAQLPAVSLEAPKKVIGSNTVSCMQSGSIYGTASMIDGMSERMIEELGYPCTIVATGGLAKDIVPHCKNKIEFCDHLLLEGLHILYQKNQI